MAEMLAAGDSANFELLNLCVWVKTNGGMGSLYRSRHELVFVFRNGREAHRNNVQLGRFGRNRTNVWNYPGANIFKRNGRKSDLDLHPTVKPIAMVVDAILDSTDLDDVIIDPFLGSGTTLLAAERARRRCHGVELDPLYVDTVIARWERLDPATSAPDVGSVVRRNQEREEREVRAPDDAYEVGYGRPPQETRWKKGQSGNPGPKKRRSASVATVEIIDRLFGEPVEIFENGAARKVSALEAILMRLWAAEMSGSKRAGRVRLQFLELVPKNDRTREIRIEDKNRANSSRVISPDAMANSRCLTAPLPQTLPSIVKNYLHNQLLNKYRGGAEGIRTDGHRGFPAANRGISPVNLKGDERQTRLRKATQP